MNNPKRKLRSQTGASLIIALVFLLFCSFVGGTVFASATANAYRVDHLSDQQAFLSERSAAMLLSDLFRFQEGQQFRLNVTDANVVTQEVIVGNGGTVVETSREPVRTREITFELVTNVPEDSVTALQRLMLEATVWRYLQQNYGSGYQKVTLANFPGRNNLGDFWIDFTPGHQAEGAAVPVIDGEMAVTTPLGSYTAHITSGTGDDLYNFQIDFTLADQESHMKLDMDAYAGTTKTLTTEDVGTYSFGAGSTGTAKITTKYTKTMISWDDPYIEKGGANG